MDYYVGKLLYIFEYDFLVIGKCVHFNFLDKWKT